MASLIFIPRENEPEETEGDFMRGLRLKLAADEHWAKLVYENEGETHPLFAKVKGGHTKEEKAKSRRRKAAQKAAWSKLKTELQSDSASKWDGSEQRGGNRVGKRDERFRGRAKAHRGNCAFRLAVAGQEMEMDQL